MKDLYWNKNKSLFSRNCHRECLVITGILNFIRLKINCHIHDFVISKLCKLSTCILKVTRNYEYCIQGFFCSA